MTATAKSALRRPVLTDTANIPRDITNLADDLDGRVVKYCTEATPSDTRPTGTDRYDGAFIFCTDTKAYGIWDASAALWRMFDTQTRTYTPTWSFGGAAGALNDGSLNGRYQRRGRLWFINVNFGFGASSNGGTGDWRFGYPPGFPGPAIVGFQEQWIPTQCYVPLAGGAMVGLCWALNDGLHPNYPKDASSNIIQNVRNADAGGSSTTAIPQATNPAVYPWTSGANLKLTGWIEANA